MPLVYATYIRSGRKPKVIDLTHTLNRTSYGLHFRSLLELYLWKLGIQHRSLLTFPSDPCLKVANQCVVVLVAWWLYSRLLLVSIGIGCKVPLKWKVEQSFFYFLSSCAICGASISLSILLCRSKPPSPSFGVEMSSLIAISYGLLVISSMLSYCEFCFLPFFRFS